MRVSMPVGLAVASLFAVSNLRAAGFAGSIISFNPGASPAGYTNSAAALGEPSRVTPGDFGGPVDPFDPPYLNSQLVSVGAGGSITVRFDAPLFDDPLNPFGLDFIIFGNSGFVITNGDYSGGGMTDGSLFGNNTNKTRVSVSADGVHFFTLDPTLAPTVDAFFPIDGGGDFHQPVNPALRPSDFAGKNLSGIAALYNGSGGGAGFDLGWARDTNGNPVVLGSVQFVRVEAFNGALDIDGFAAVNPAGLAFTEDFSTNPAADGWLTTGNASLFQWDSQAQNLRVTWDSSKSNSFYLHPLGTILRRSDNFSFAFDLTLADIAVGTDPGHPFTFELALGLMKQADANDPNLRRGTGINSPNLVEYSYFPDSGFGATVSPVIVTTNSQFFAGFSFPLTMTTNDLFHVLLTYTATNQTLATTILRNGASFGPVTNAVLPSTAPDFRVDSFAIKNYNDSGADGSIVAHGVVDNVRVSVPAPPVKGFAGTVAFNSTPGGAPRTWQTTIPTAAGWTYALERASDLGAWSQVGGTVAGTGGAITLNDAAPPSGRAFYRVRADLP